jgi:hypothetical protein
MNRITVEFDTSTDKGLCKAKAFVNEAWRGVCDKVRGELWQLQKDHPENAEYKRLYDLMCCEMSALDYL